MCDYKPVYSCTMPPSLQDGLVYRNTPVESYSLFCKVPVLPSDKAIKSSHFPPYYCGFSLISLLLKCATGTKESMMKGKTITDSCAVPCVDPYFIHILWVKCTWITCRYFFHLFTGDYDLNMSWLLCLETSLPKLPELISIAQVCHVILQYPPLKNSQ